MTVMSNLRPAAGPGGKTRTKTLRIDLSYIKTGFANLFFYGEPSSRSEPWVLIDAGVPGSTGRILKAAEERFGADARPAAIVLTHGHFDHVGGLPELADRWQVSIYAHRLELPYLTRKSPYPPPDPSVGGGALSLLSPLYPRGPFDFGPRVRALPEDGSVPGMPGWQWIHTPGHTPGHVSFFREADRTLIAGDAFVTTRQESALAALTYPVQLHGPPAYFTSDWDSARESVRRLAALEPAVVATGHGLPLEGGAMRKGLHNLAQNFDRVARPARGRYVRQPALADERGVVALPPPVSSPLPKVALALGAGVVLAAVLGRTVRRH
jgi:glyoxylase-like metal-dependent hydrolase (beta-lactamase superfamily II)